MLPALLLATGLLSQAASQVQVEPLPFDPATLRSLPRCVVEVDEAGVKTSYSGVPLHVVLRRKLEGQPEMQALRSIANAVVVVGASDDYQIALSAAAVAMDSKGERFLIAFDRDGEPLDDTQGPAKLIVTGDPRRVRWVRMMSSVALVRLPKLPLPPHR